MECDLRHFVPGTQNESFQVVIGILVRAKVMLQKPIVLPVFRKHDWSIVGLKNFHTCFSLHQYLNSIYLWSNKNSWKYEFRILITSYEHIFISNWPLQHVVHSQEASRNSKLLNSDHLSSLMMPFIKPFILCIRVFLFFLRGLKRLFVRQNTDDKDSRKNERYIRWGT